MEPPSRLDLTGHEGHKKMRILIVDADKSEAHQLHTEMLSARYVPETTHNAEEAIEYLRAYPFDIAIIALGDTAFDGLQLIREIRTARLDVPIMALTAATKPGLRLQALNSGADDAVSRPISRDVLEEMMARTRAITRRAAGFSQSEITLGPVRVMLDSREVYVGDASLHLTNKEFEILQVLVKRRNTVISKETFLTALYGGLDTPDPKIIDVFICKLRKKLKHKGCGDLIQTAWGKGYVIRGSKIREGEAAAEAARAANAMPTAVAA